VSRRRINVFGKGKLLLNGSNASQAIAAPSSLLGTGASICREAFLTAFKAASSYRG